MKVHSFTNDVLETFDGVDIAELIRKKKIDPKEVVAASIERADKVNAHINAIAYKNYDNAIAFAEKEEASGYFAGVPLFFKDMTVIKGIPATYGSEAFEGAIPAKENDKIAKQILQMGFVNLGMSTMPEFGFISSTEFPHLDNTTNPWNTAYSTGGSSGGSSALVAAGVIPIGHSADGGGSTRIPANCCGLVGLKPTRGRLLRSKMLETQIHEIAIDGVVTRSVRDTAQFYYEAEKYYHNKKLPQIGLVTEPITRKLKIGYIEEGLSLDMVDQKTIDAFKKTISLLENLGHELVPVKFPVNDRTVEDFKLLWSSSGFAVKYFGKVMFPKPYNPRKLTNFTNGLAKYYFDRILRTPKMLYRLKRSTNEFHDFLNNEGIDVMLSPTMGHTTPTIGYVDMSLDYDTVMSRMEKWARFTPLSNANGCPSINLPMQHDDENDLPIGMLLWANNGQERLLLELSYQVEEAAPWRKIYA